MYLIVKSRISSLILQFLIRKPAISDTKNVMAPRRSFSRPFSTLRLPQRLRMLPHRPPSLPCSTWCCSTRPQSLCGLLGARGVLISDTKCSFLIRKPDGAPATSSSAILVLAACFVLLTVCLESPAPPLQIGVLYASSTQPPYYRKRLSRAAKRTFLIRNAHF